MLIEFVYQTPAGPLSYSIDEDQLAMLDDTTLDLLERGDSVVAYEYFFDGANAFTTTPHKESRVFPVQAMTRGLLRRFDDPMEFELVPFDEFNLDHHAAATRFYET
jgi:hypothetical protein